MKANAGNRLRKLLNPSGPTGLRDGLGNQSQPWGERTPACLGTSTSSPHPAESQTPPVDSSDGKCSVCPQSPPGAPEGSKLCPNWTPGTSRPQDLEDPVTAQPVHVTHKPLSPQRDRGANLTPFVLSMALTAECPPDPRSSPSSSQTPSSCRKGPCSGQA